MTTINHWGKWIDSESPVTGVISIHNVNLEFLDDSICLDCEQAIKEIESDESMTDEQKQDELEFLECDSSHAKLLGDWKQDDKGLYMPDETGEFAAIERESEIQVVWSKTVKQNVNVCSPCFPGQVDLDSTGQFQGYTLPDYLIEKE